MRSISTASLNKLSQKTGTEPMCLVEVEWTPGQTRLYGDKSIQVEGIDGRIVQLTAVDDVLNISRQTTSQSVTVTLDDADGEMKAIFNGTDIHKKRVTVYQWFTGIPLSDRFVLFSGVTASPITWKEGDRTLTFSVISKAEDAEVGFSPEEGQFPNLPQGMVGQVWPLVFGTVQKMPCVRVDEIPYTDGTGDLADSQTTDDHGIEDPAIEPHTKDQAAHADYAAQLAQLYFLGYLQASYTARKLGELDEFDSIDKGKGTYSSMAKQFLSQGNKFLLEAQRIRRANTDANTVLQKQKSYNTKQIGVTNGTLFPQGADMRIQIGQGQYTGYFLGNVFHINEARHPQAEKYDGIQTEVPDSGEPLNNYVRDNFFWNPAGQRLSIGVIAGAASEQPANIRYIVAATLQVAVRVVYATRDVDGQRRLSVVPPNLYSVQNTSFGTLPVTLLLVPSPLSSLTDAAGKSLGWDDDLWVTVTSPVGPNTASIIQWLVETYTSHEVDAASFADASARLAPYPSHFAVTDRPNVMQLVQEIAHQARCIVWLKNNVFHIKFLAVRESPVATLAEADVIEQSLEVSYTETEDLTTKLKASWRADMHARNKNLVILRYNIAYYGLHEKAEDYFIYNMQQLVEKSAVFWMIRESNTYKRVGCKVPIRFLNIETLDTVTLNFSHDFIASGPVDCVVESATVDTGDYTISLTLWVPVRAGEMTEYLFAFPAGLSVEYFWPTEEDATVGRAGAGHDVPFNNAVALPTTGAPEVKKPFTGDTGNSGSVHVTNRPHTWGMDPSYFSDVGNVAPEIVTRIDETALKPISAEKPEGTSRYQLRKSKVTDSAIVTSNFTTCFPAKVTGGGPGKGPYALEVYMQGVASRATTVDEAYQLQIFDDDQIPEGTWCFVNRLVYVADDESTKVEWYIQLPVWM